MKDQEFRFYQAVVRENLVDDARFLKRAEKGKTEAPKAQIRSFASPKASPRRRFSWVGAVQTVAAVAAVAVILTASIPAARAEVLSWFGFSKPEDYFAAAPDTREPVEELDALITTQAPNESNVRVTYAIDEPLWQEVAKNFSATLGEAMYDGENLYQVVDFAGIGGVGVYENEWGGGWKAGEKLVGLTMEPLDGNMAHYYYDDNADTSMFVSGRMTYWMGVSNFLVYELPDGSRLSNMIWMLPREEDTFAFQAMGRSQFGEPLPAWTRETDAEIEAFNQETLDFLQTHGIRGLCKIYLTAEENGERTEWFANLLKNADENGILTAMVSYEVVHDLGEENQLKFKADLGTVQVDLKAFESMPKRTLYGPMQSVSWHGEQAFGNTDWEGDVCSVTAYQADTDGLWMRAGMGTVDVRGIHDLRVSISFPKDWDEPMCRAFARGLDFKAEIDGEAVPLGLSRQMQKTLSGYELVLSCSGVPFETLRQMQTLRLIPALNNAYAIEIRALRPEGSEGPDPILGTRTLRPGESFSDADLAPGTYFVTAGDVTELPEFAIDWEIR